MSPKFKQMKSRWVKSKVSAAHPLPLCIVSVSKTGAILRPLCSKASLQLFLSDRFCRKPRPPRVSLESLGLGNVIQVQGNQVQGPNQSYCSPTLFFCRVSISKHTLYYGYYAQKQVCDCFSPVDFAKNQGHHELV